MRALRAGADQGRGRTRSRISPSIQRPYLASSPWSRVAQVQMVGGQSVLKGANGREYLLEEEQRGDEVGAAAHAKSQGRE
jgi:hypothetical protein